MFSLGTNYFNYFVKWRMWHIRFSGMIWIKNPRNSVGSTIFICDICSTFINSISLTIYGHTWLIALYFVLSKLRNYFEIWHKTYQRPSNAPKTSWPWLGLVSTFALCSISEMSRSNLSQRSKDSTFWTQYMFSRSGSE